MVASDWRFCWTGLGSEACGEGHWAARPRGLGVQHGDPGDLGSGVGLILLQHLILPLGCASVSPLHLAIIFHVKDISAAREKGRSLPSEAKPEFHARSPEGAAGPRPYSRTGKRLSFHVRSEKGFGYDGSRRQEQARGGCSAGGGRGPKARGVPSDELPPGSSLTAGPAPGQHSKGGRLPSAGPQAPTGGQAGA